MFLLFLLFFIYLFYLLITLHVRQENEQAISNTILTGPPNLETHRSTWKQTKNIPFNVLSNTHLVNFSSVVNSHFPSVQISRSFSWQTSVLPYGGSVSIFANFEEPPLYDSLVFLCDYLLFLCNHYSVVSPLFYKIKPIMICICNLITQIMIVTHCSPVNAIYQTTFTQKQTEITELILNPIPRPICKQDKQTKEKITNETKHVARNSSHNWFLILYSSGYKIQSCLIYCKISVYVIIMWIISKMKRARNSSRESWSVTDWRTLHERNQRNRAKCI